MGFQSNFNSFINGMAFGFAVNSPFCCGWRCCMPPAMNFGMFTNPFLNMFDYNTSILPPPPMFSIPSPSVWNMQLTQNNYSNMSFGGMPSVFSLYDMPFSDPIYSFGPAFMPQTWSTSKTQSSDSQQTDGNAGNNNKTLFNKMAEFVFKREGEYVNHPDDRGGATNMGITQTTYDEYRKSKGLESKDVKDLTKDEATDIYYENYYVKSGADKISDPKLAMCVFDWAINSGVNNNAMKEALESCNGNVTDFIQARRKYLDNLIAKNPSQETFRNGWNNRLDELETFVETI